MRVFKFLNRLLSRGPSMFLLGACAGALLMPSVSLAQKDTPPERSEKTELSKEMQLIVGTITHLGRQPLVDPWPILDSLKRRFRACSSEEAAALLPQAAGSSDATSLYAAALLLSRPESRLHAEGQVLLQRLIRNETARKKQRIAAMRLLAKTSFSQSAYLVLKEIAEDATDVDIQLEASLALWHLENDPSALRPALVLLNDPDDHQRYKAALILAEAGYHLPRVMDTLRVLRREPTERGKKANLLLHLATTGESSDADALDHPRRRAELQAKVRLLQKEVERLEGVLAEVSDRSGGWQVLFREVHAAIRRYSIHSDRVVLGDLLTNAVKGMVAQLDRYSVFLGPAEVAQRKAKRIGVGLGIGIRLTKPSKTSPLIVVKATPRGPAHREGIRTGDRIVDVNGVDTRTHDLDEIEQIAAAGGVRISLGVTSRRWKGVRWVTLAAGELKTPQVNGRLLPGEIGYIKVSRFTKQAVQEFETFLDRLEKRGLRGLVIDLRDSPGGSREAAVRFVDLFVGDSLLLPIATFINRDGERVDSPFPTPEQKFVHPMAVLVNRFTASAAEMVAGSLQDFERATIVGEQTYGKGVEQINLRMSPQVEALLGGESWLLLSTRYIHLPLGRRLHRPRDARGRPLSDAGGVQPDVVVPHMYSAVSEEKVLELERLMFAPAIEKYIELNAGVIDRMYAEGDIWDPENDLGREEELRALYASLETPLPFADMMRALRRRIRLHLEQESEAAPAGDFRDDRPLRKAILEVLRKGGYRPEEIPQYSSLVEPGEE